MRRLPTRALLVAVSVAASIVFGYLALREVNAGKTWHALRTSNYWWLLPSFALLVLSLAVRAERWRLLFAPRRRPPARPAAKAFVIGLLFNVILPARAGEVARAIALKAYAGTSRAEGLATIVVERVIDLLALLAFLFVTLPWLPHVSWLRAAVIVAAVATAGAIGIVAVAVMLSRRTHTRLSRLLARFPLLDEEAATQMLSNTLHGLAAIRGVRQALAVLVTTVVSWLALAASFWVLMLGFGLHLPFLAGLLVAVSTGLSFIIPSAPAAVGVFEAAGLAATSAYRISTSHALAYVLVLHAMNVLPFVVAGLVVLAGNRAARDRSTITILDR